MKQTIKILTALLVLLVTGSTGAWAQTFSGGSGTSTDPYQIKTIADMTALATAVNGGTDYSSTYFLLMSDITYSSTDAYTVIGGEGHAFAGNFNGNGNTIKGIRYNYTEDSSADIGLFGYVINGKVENLTLDDCWFQKTGTSNGDIAVVVGYANHTEIDKVIVKNCKAIAKNGNAAGITAYAYSPVTNCVVENTEISVFDGTTLNGIAGGIVAYENGSSASNNVVLQCTIQANHVGGVCGDSFTGGPIDNNHVENCTITGKESAGGISTVAGYDGSYAHGFSHTGNTVAGTTIVQAVDAAGALFAQKGYNGWTDNYYAMEVKVIIGSTTYDGTTARGYYNGSAPANADGVGEGTFYKATVVANPAAGGTASINRQWCLAGKSMTSTVTATPNAGINFLGWTSTDVTLTDASASTTTFTKVLTSAVTITANFGAGLSLKNNLTNATVTFYDYGTTAPTKESFSTSAPGTETNSIESGNYVVAHIVPADDYWTDEKLLMSMEAGTLSPARRRDIGLDLGRKLTLLKVDEYDPGDGVMVPRHDGAGWYYYQIPSAHTMAAGYTSSVIEGYSPKKFDFSYENSSNVSQNGTLITINNGEGWTAELTLNAISFPFTGEDIGPEFTNVTVKKSIGTKEIKITLAKTDIENQLRTPYKISVISSDLQVRTNAKSEYTWFKKYSGDDAYVANGSESSTYAITLPFTVANETASKGTETNPWLIRTAAELDLLAKCVNVGQYRFSGEFLQQTADIDMSDINDANGKNDFLPIGNINNNFCGTFDGNSNTISNQTLNPVAGDLVEDGSGYSIGLFGYAVNSTIKNVTLSNCTFTFTGNDRVSIGGIVGCLFGGGITGSTVKECTISATVTASDYLEVGGIVGSSTADAIISGCTVTSCTIGGTGGNDAVGGVVGLVENVGPLGVRGLCSVRMKASAEVPIKGNRVNSTAEKKTTITGNYASAIIGVLNVPSSVVGNHISDNLYDYNVEVTQGTTAFKAYTKRGINIITGGTADNPEYTFTDYETNSGAMMEIYPITLSVTTITGYSPTLQIDANPTTETVDALVAESTCYKIVSDVPYLAAGDVKTLVVAPTIERTDDGRTFHADLTALTLNNNALTVPTSGNTTTFTMPSADATIRASYAEANWFTIPSNGKSWMSFYHEWKDATGAAANYTVSDGSGTGKTIKAKTVESFNLITGAVTPVDLSNVSYSGVPTLFHCDPLKDSNTNTLTSLPALLKFTPVADKTAPKYDYRIKGVTTDTTLDGNFIFVMNGLGDFISAYDKSEPLKAHRCYVDLSATPTNATRLYILVDGEETGIETPLLTPPLEGAGSWYDLQGRRLDGKPTKKGLYINGGRKVVIK